MSKINRPLEPEDFGTNSSGNPYFGTTIETRLARRQVLLGGLSTAALSMFGLSACGGGDDDPAPAVNTPPANTLNFNSVTKTPMIAGDDLILPAGYTWTALMKHGDPIGSTLGSPAFKSTAARRFDTSADDAQLQFGDNHDGLEFFPLPIGSTTGDRGLLVTNHEAGRGNTSSGFRFVSLPNTSGAATQADARARVDAYAATVPSADKEYSFQPEVVRKQKAYHGVSVAEVYRDAASGEWKIQANSRYARKVHADTWIDITGPARGHAAMRTSYDPLGEQVRGTLGNCGSGFTPWGTYLTCEEDCHKNYFATVNIPDARWAELNSPRWVRYGIGDGSNKYTRDYSWHLVDERFDLNAEPNETNRFGWVVEIDPHDASARPAKRTAMGRFAHENCAFLINADQRVAIYMGDDQGFDYIYKFVTARPMSSERSGNRNLLDEGTLYVARYNEDGSGTWLPLVYGQGPLTEGNGFTSQADVLIWARLAADLLGATQMDRPEWLDSDAKTGWVYATLSNNNARPAADTPGGAPGGRVAKGVDKANPRKNNKHGHIIRMRDDGGNVAGTAFKWEMVVLAGTPTSPNADAQGNINGDAFSSPDSVMFDQYQRLWIGTDAADQLAAADLTGAGTDWAGLGNDMLLAMDTRTGQVKRFLVAPDGAEVCGTVLSPDGKTLFVNMQHPGTEQSRTGVAAMTWPDKIAVTQGGVTRSCTVAITRVDRGLIGI